MNKYCEKYESRIGTIWLFSDGEWLTGLGFDKRANGASKSEQSEAFFTVKDGKVEKARAERGKNCRSAEEIFGKTKVFLDGYFSGEKAECDVPLRFRGTPFQLLVWEELLNVPYGMTVTYGKIAQKLASVLGKKKMSAQAVGQAVSKNPIAIIAPCHRVLGKGGRLTGFAGGIEKKIELLKTENIAGYKE